MHLTQRESERLLLHAGAELARRRLARGARLGATEAVALVCDEICELAWDGVPLDEIIAKARQVLRSDQLVDGVASAVPSLQTEALFPYGTVLVHVDRPFGEPATEGPGGVATPACDVVLAPGRPRTTAILHNGGAQPVWLSSHMPLDLVNPAVKVDVDGDGRYRLDVPAGVALRIDAGSSRKVDVVRLGGTA